MRVCELYILPLVVDNIVAFYVVSGDGEDEVVVEDDKGVVKDGKVERGQILPLVLRRVVLAESVHCFSERVQPSSHIYLLLHIAHSETLPFIWHLILIHQQSSFHLHTVHQVQAFIVLPIHSSHYVYLYYIITLLHFILLYYFIILFFIYHLSHSLKIFLVFLNILFIKISYIHYIII